MLDYKDVGVEVTVNSFPIPPKPQEKDFPRSQLSHRQVIQLLTIKVIVSKVILLTNGNNKTGDDREHYNNSDQRCIYIAFCLLILSYLSTLTLLCPALNIQLRAGEYLALQYHTPTHWWIALTTLYLLFQVRTWALYLFSELDLLWFSVKFHNFLHLTVSVILWSKSLILDFQSVVISPWQPCMSIILVVLLLARLC